MARGTRSTISVAPEVESRRKSGTVTSYDVANHAGVSQSAVSRCFTPGASLAQRTRDRIMVAADALGYRPNAIARSLITKRSNLVAVILANIGFNPEFALDVSRGLASRGLHPLLFALDNEADADQAIDQLWQYRVDGIVSAAQLSADQIEMLGRRTIPMVFLNRAHTAIAANSVSCDQVEGERWLVERLVAAGHRRFGVITGPEASTVSLQRVGGAVDHLKAYNINEITVVPGDFTYDGGRKALNALAKSAPPEAIICANDLMAIGCIDGIRKDLNLRVPEDISVVGFDGLESARWASYDLATIRQPTRVMIDSAINMLVARIEDPTLALERRIFSGELILGSSAKLG